MLPSRKYGSIEVRPVVDTRTGPLARRGAFSLSKRLIEGAMKTAAESTVLRAALVQPVSWCPCLQTIVGDAYVAWLPDLGVGQTQDATYVTAERRISVRERLRQPEPSEHAIVEAGHGADPSAGEGEDEEAGSVADAAGGGRVGTRSCDRRRMRLCP